MHYEVCTRDVPRLEISCSSTRAHALHVCSHRTIQLQALVISTFADGQIFSTQITFYQDLP